MGKYLFIAEKPSVAKEFAKVLKVNGGAKTGYLESEKFIITWCVGHLVTMSYPEKYNESYKKWKFEDLPFIPDEFLYEVIPSAGKQYKIVKDLLNREDVERIYVCTDSGREGEYIYRLVDEMAKVPDTKDKRRVWIDSQTEDEIIKGIKTAKPISEYDNLAASAYLRAQEDYLIGINFSRALTLKYAQRVNYFIPSKKWIPISVGRVMTCVLGMVVIREQEIRDFVKTVFYRVIGTFGNEEGKIEAEWKATENSKYFNDPKLYKDSGFLDKEEAEKFIKYLMEPEDDKSAVITAISKKKEKNQAPLLFNLAELQNTCSKLFKISPDETLKAVQELYEKKLVTYPRTDARVLSTAVAKEITKNISGLKNYDLVSGIASEILEKKLYTGLEKTKYVNDKKITDHYAIVPTGQGLQNLNSLKPELQKIYEVIVRRFLAVFYPPIVNLRVSVTLNRKNEEFNASFKEQIDDGWLPVSELSFIKKKEGTEPGIPKEFLSKLKKGQKLDIQSLDTKEGETSPPKRYNSGSMILAMENAGQLIEDEELRAQIKGSGIGTSATRAEILNKLVKIKYIDLNKKTQIITPTLRGELVFYVVRMSIKSLLNPKFTASWEKGLTMVAEGEINEEQYNVKLYDFINKNTNRVRNINNQSVVDKAYMKIKSYYK